MVEVKVRLRKLQDSWKDSLDRYVVVLCCWNLRSLSWRDCRSIEADGGGHRWDRRCELLLPLKSLAKSPIYICEGWASIRLWKSERVVHGLSVSPTMKASVPV